MTRRNWRALVLAAALMPSLARREIASSEAAVGDADLAGDWKSGRRRLDAAAESELAQDMRQPAA